MQFHRFLPLALLAASPAVPSAQDVADPLPGDALFGRGLIGFEQLDADSFVGVGDAYKAYFEPGYVSVIPVLGLAAPHNMPLEFELESVWHGEAMLLEVGAPVAPEGGESSVAYAHAGGIVERYEVRPEGVYQSFEFPTRPVGGGDLVVRGNLATELVPSPKDGGYAFTLPGIGGLEYTAVYGIDADGWTFPGELVVDGSAVELRLAAEDVARASFPLVLDPLLGGTINVSTGGTDDDNVDVAYSPALNRSLVVWNRRISSTDSDILGLQVQNETTTGSLRLIETSGGVARLPSVAFNPQTSRFLVAWQDQPSAFSDLDIQSRTVASNGTIGPFIPIATTSANERDPDVGGERSDIDDECLVTWEEDGTGIRVAQVRVTSGNEGVLAGGPVLSTSTDVRFPAISKAPDDSGVFLVVWEQTIGNFTKIRGRAITRNDTILTDVTPISDPIGLDLLNDSKPDVDTTGDGFVVVYEENESLQNDKHDIEAVRFFYDAGNLVWDSTNVEIEADDDDDEIRPSVTFTGESLIVAYHDEAGTSYDGYLRPVDPYSCQSGLEVRYDFSASNPTSLSVASRWSGGSASSQFVVAWDSNDASGEGDVFARAALNPDNTTNLGGGCGNVGELRIPVPINGNDTFRVHLRDSVPGVLSVLAVSPNAGTFGCGPCNIGVNLSQVQLYVQTVNADGDNSMLFPIPNGFGPADFFVQWAVFAGGSCPFLGGFEMTDTIQTDITSF